MARIMIRNLDDDMRARLRIRAAEHHRSMEKEVRTVLRDAVDGGRTGSQGLLHLTRECFGP